MRRAVFPVSAANTSNRCLVNTQPVTHMQLASLLACMGGDRQTIGILHARI